MHIKKSFIYKYYHRVRSNMCWCNCEPRESSGHV